MCGTGGPMQASIKGVALQFSVAAIRRALDAGRLSWMDLEAVLQSEDIRILEDKIVPGMWYPIRIVCTTGTNDDGPVAGLGDGVSHFIDAGLLAGAGQGRLVIQAAASNRFDRARDGRHGGTRTAIPPVDHLHRVSRECLEVL